MRNAVLMPLHLDAFVGQNLTFSHQISVQLKTSEHFRAHFFVFWAQFSQNVGIFGLILSFHALNDGKIRAPCVIRGARAAKGAPFLAGSSRGAFPKGGLRGFSDAWRAYPARASPFSDAWRENLAANWRFSRPRPLSGCMERKTCHGLMPGNAPRRNLATARPLGTHRARILPLPVGPRAHQGAIPPPPDAGGGRTARAFCHRRAPGNAPWRNLVTTSRPRTHFAHILPSPGAWECIASIPCHWQTSENAQRRHTATASRPSRSALHAREWVQALGCAVGFGAQYFLCEGVGIPSPRGLTAGNDFESALFRWATMSSLRVLRSCAVLCAEAKSALTFI